MRDIKVYKGATGICRDDSGICISILNTGKHYPDDIFDGGILYHYPDTQRPKTFDINEINSTKECLKLNIPIFVILPGNNSKTRKVRLGWVNDYDDDSQLFLIEFGEIQPKKPIFKKPNFKISQKENQKKHL